ncbi:MAG: GNAT family N-acetyltransferase [Planctomycetota bacterium]
MSPTSSRVDIDVLSLEELTSSDLAAWESYREDQSVYEAPFFSTRFAQAVGRARNDVWVARIEHQDVGPAFLPFHCRRVGFGRVVGVPVGRFLNDAHYVIGPPELEIDWTAILKAMGVVAFDCHALVGGTDHLIDQHQLQTVKAYRADFNGDSPAFLELLQQQHRTISKQGQKTRKLSREVGSLRLEVDCRCPNVLQQTIQWKRDQYQRTHILDLFAPEWTRKLIDELYSDPLKDTDGSTSFADSPMRGLLSVLWAGDRVAAAHVGMVERGRLHYWFPTYDLGLAKYSPGTALFVELVRAATEHAIDVIDMGYGEQPYKQKQTATISTVAAGTITNSPVHRIAFQSQARAIDWLKRIPMKETAKAAWRTIHPNAGMRKLN